MIAGAEHERWRRGEWALQNGVSSNKRVKYGSEEFGRAVVKIAVAQVCERGGYQAFQQSALETLSNVAVRYVESLGKGAEFYSNLAGRTGCNIFDIVQSLEDFGAVHGFAGASEIDRCLASSGTVKELIRYVSEAEEIPFAYDVPQFPVVRDRKLAPSFSQVEVEPPGCHIPSWLPAFPDPSTLISVSGKGERGDNLEQTDKVEHLGKQKEEPPVLSLHQRVSHNRLEGPSTGASDSSARANPFLAAPLNYSEVKVMPIVFPRKPVHDTSPKKVISENHLHLENHVSEKEKLTHTTNQLENHLHASENDKSTTLTNQRAVVKFRIRVSKKYHITSADADDGEICISDSTAPFTIIETDIKRADMKWMADRNLKGSMEIPEELSRL